MVLRELATWIWSKVTVFVFGHWMCLTPRFAGILMPLLLLLVPMLLVLRLVIVLLPLSLCRYTAKGSRH